MAEEVVQRRAGQKLMPEPTIAQSTQAGFLSNTERPLPDSERNLPAGHCARVEGGWKGEWKIAATGRHVCGDGNQTASHTPTH